MNATHAQCADEDKEAEEMSVHGKTFGLRANYNIPGWTSTTGLCEFIISGLIACGRVKNAVTSEGPSCGTVGKYAGGT
jgi:hypothetical protein